MAQTFQFIGGGEDFLVAEEGKTAWAALSEGLDDEFGREIVDGDAQKVDEVEEMVTRFQQAVETLPMFGGDKAVWFRRVSFLADTIVGKSETTQKALERMQDFLPRAARGGVRILITASPVDRRRSFYNFLKKEADLHWIEDPKGKGGERVLADFVQSVAARENVRIEPAAVDILLAQLNGSVRLVKEELAKLATYLGDTGERITPELVMELVPVFGDGDFFEAAEAFFSQDLDWTLRVVENHFFAGNSIRPLLTSWQNRNRLLIQLRVLLDADALRLGPRGLGKDAVEKVRALYGEVFGSGTEKSSYQIFGQHPFYLSKLAESARRIPLKKLMQWQTEFYQAFAETLQPQTPEAEVARQLVLRCLKGEG